MMECKFYNKLENNVVECILCPHYCKIRDGSRGICRARYNKGGVLYTENDNLSSLSLDPIEKKPLAKYFPTTKILSAGASGCNLHCSFCQNWQISQCENRNDIKMKPRELLEKALELVSSENIGLAYTYSEPIVMFEYVIEAASLIRKNNLKNVFVSNGYINEEPLLELLEYIDAFNIDVKAFSSEDYLKHFKAEFAIIKRNLEIIIKNKKHLEISCLIVPGINDDIEEAEEFFKWLSDLDQEIPVHVNRYYPNYKAKMPATDISSLDEIVKIATAYMKNVYVGNI